MFRDRPHSGDKEAGKGWPQSTSSQACACGLLKVVRAYGVCRPDSDRLPALQPVDKVLLLYLNPCPRQQIGPHLLTTSRDLFVC